MYVAWLLLCVVNANAWLFPVPTDKFGWGLRLRPSECHDFYLLKESIWHHQLRVVLINQTRDARQASPLATARKVRNLKISMHPSTMTLNTHPDDNDTSPVKASLQLPAGHSHTSVIKFPDLHFSQFQKTGDHEMTASLKTAEGLVVAPVFKFKVIEPAADAILFRQPVPLEGQFAKWATERQERAVIQQIKIGNRTWLFYRKYNSAQSGGEVYASFRIAELPGKVVDFKVEGAFGNNNPLTITYRETTYTKWTTTHVINSIDGKPWTAEEEKHRQEKRKLEAKLPAEKK